MDFFFYKILQEIISLSIVLCLFIHKIGSKHDRETISSIQREILRKRPKNNNKAWIKLSETILSILGDCWGTFICSSLPARLMEEFSASKETYNLQPDLLWSFPANVSPDITLASLVVDIGQNSALQSGVGRGGFSQIMTNSTYQLFEDQRTKSPQTPWIFYFLATISPFMDILFFSKSPSQRKIAWRTDILRNRSDPLGPPGL